MSNDFFLPDAIPQPDITQYEGWTPESVILQIGKQIKHIERLKPKVEDVIMLFWVAHEKIINKHPDWTEWTWGRFCEECGYSDRTPINWFNKYGLAFTRSFSAVGNRSPKNLGDDNPPKKQTKPNIKLQLDQAVQAIKEEQISDDDLKQNRSSKYYFN